MSGQFEMVGIRPLPPAEPPRPAPAPMAADPAPAAQGGDSAFWPSFAAGLRGKVPPTVMPYLNNPAKVAGVRKNGQLTLWVDSEFTRSMLNKPSVLEKLAQAAEPLFGQPPRVIVTVGTPPEQSEAPEEDPLNKLMSFGDLDNITIQ